MIPLETHNLYVVGRLVAEAVDDLNISERSSVKYIMDNMAKHISRNNGGVLVNNVEDPTHIIWYAINHSALLDQKMFQVPLFFITKEQRGDSEKLNLMHKMIEDGKAFHKCDIATGGSWENGDTTSNSARMWEKAGYSQMETVHEK